MKTSTKRTVIYCLIEILFTLLIGGYFFYLKNSYSVETIYSKPLFNIVILGLIILIWTIGPMLNRYVVYAYGFLFGIYLISQDIYFRAFGQFYRFNTAISLSSEVIGAKDSALEFVTINDIAPLIYLTVVTVIFIILYFVLQRKCFKLIYRIPYKIAFLLLIIPMMNNWNAYNDLLDEARHQEDSFQLNKTDYYIYDVIPNVNQFVEKFGIIPFGLRDAISLYESDVIGANDYQEISDFLNSKKKHQDNAMTGIFEGKNIIFIQAESFIDAAIDERLTPTLYKMKHEGINVVDFDTPLLVGSTSDTEFMTNTSIIPNSEGYAICYKYPYNTFDTTLAKMFNDIGYNTIAYHNNYSTYYNRNVVFPNFGYNQFVDCTGLGLEDEQFDSTVLEILKWIYVETDKPYLAYWITYSGHQPYSYNSVGVNQSDVDKIKNVYPDLNEEYVAYLAKNMDLDKSLSLFMRELGKVGKLDDVVFVFFGDHIVKGIDFESNYFYEQTGRENSMSKRYTDLFIYNSVTEPMEYRKVSTVLDILPTIANMWGLDIDYSTVLGNDIFDEDYRGFYFSDYGIIKTNDFTYDYINDNISIQGNISQDEALKQANELLKVKEIAGKILKSDYFEEKGTK